VRQPFIVPAIRGSDVGFLERPDIRSFEHLLELLDFVNDAFDVHPKQYSEPALTRHFAASAWGISFAFIAALKNGRIDKRNRHFKRRRIY
jgi:hypothetical protein